MPSFSFATFLIVCPTSFFLGILFSMFPYDYPLLWAGAPTPDSHFDAIEAHVRLLHASPLLIVRILHIMIFLGLVGLITKLYKPSESNMLFDGGSLVLYMCAVIVYITNIVKGLRIVTVGEYGAGLDALSADEVDELSGGGYDEQGDSVLGREDNLKVLSASNTILALVLVGVLVLQAGQWYAERSDEKERKKMLEEAASASVTTPTSPTTAKEGKDGASSSSVPKKSNSAKESKKSK